MLTVVMRFAAARCVGGGSRRISSKSSPSPPPTTTLQQRHDSQFLWKPQCQLANIKEQNAYGEFWAISTEDFSTPLLPGDSRVQTGTLWLHQHVDVCEIFNEHLGPLLAKAQWQFPFDMEQLHLTFTSRWCYNNVVLKFSQLETSDISVDGFMSSTYDMHKPRLIDFDSDWGDGNLSFLSREHELPMFAMVITRKSGVLWKSSCSPKLFSR